MKKIINESPIDKITRAKNEYELVLEDKRRVLAITEDLKQEITKLETIIESKKIEREKAERWLWDIKATLETEKKELKTSILEAESELKTLNTAINEKKQALKGVLEAVTIAKSKYKEELNKEIAEINRLETQKKEKKKGIELLNSRGLSILGQIDAKETELKKISKEVEETEKIKEKVEKQIADLEIEKGVIEQEIEANKIIIAEQEKIIVAKKRELSDFDDKIAKKTEEYKQVESLAFVILKKQEALEKKEEFIKAQYERAGIKYI